MKKTLLNMGGLMTLCVLSLLLSPLVAGGQTASSAQSSRDDRPIQIDSGNLVTCGIRTDGTVACWGENTNGLTNPPAGTFTNVSAGSHHACAVGTNEKLSCWGANTEGQSNAPGGNFTQVSAGYDHTCGLRTDGVIVCWGLQIQGQTPVPPGTYSSLSAGDGHTCGMKTTGELACWGTNYYGQLNVPPGDFKQVSGGGHHTCGLKTDNTIVCWGYDMYGQDDVPTGTYTSVSSGYFHSCALRPDGTITCWGDNSQQQSTAPEGRFSAISAGRYHNCAVKMDGTMICWGTYDYGQLTPPPPKVSLSISSPILTEAGEVIAISVQLSERGFQNVIVNLAFSGTAVLGEDYYTSALTTTINVNNDSSTILLVGANDGVLEPDETIIVDIATVVNGVEDGVQRVTSIIPGTGSPDSLIQNTGFEISDLAAWNVKNATGDKVKCKPEKARSGNCAFMFKGGAGENSSLQQTITPLLGRETAAIFTAGDILNLSMFVNGKGSTQGKVKLKVKYADGTPADKLTANLPTTGAYEPITDTLTLTGSNVSSIKLQIKHQSASGKTFIDDVILTHSTGAALLPLP